LGDGLECAWFLLEEQGYARLPPKTCGMGKELLWLNSLDEAPAWP
jgi:hypothetical protein